MISSVGPFGRWILQSVGKWARVILEGLSGLLIEKSLRFAFKVSNNQVDYEALIAGMFLAKELRARSLLVNSDSLFLTGKVTGEYQAKDSQLASYLMYVTILKAVFSTFDLVSVPKEQNSRADLLSKLASSGKGGRQRSVIQEILKSPRTAEGGPTEVSNMDVLGINSGIERRHCSMTQETLRVPRITTYGLWEDEFLEVLQVDTTETWITPYQRYLADGLLPAEPTEAKTVT